MTGRGREEDGVRMNREKNGKTAEDAEGNVKKRKYELSFGHCKPIIL